MQYNEVQLQEYKRQFALRRRRQFLLAIPILVMFVGLIALDEKTLMIFGTIPASVFVPIGVALVAGAVFMSFKNWRRPACDKYLGRSFSIDFCPKCGVPLK